MKLKHTRSHFTVCSKMSQSRSKPFQQLFHKLYTRGLFVWLKKMLFNCTFSTLKRFEMKFLLKKEFQFEPSGSSSCVFAFIPLCLFFIFTFSFWVLVVDNICLFFFNLFYNAKIKWLVMQYITEASCYCAKHSTSFFLLSAVLTKQCVKWTMFQ